MEIYIAASVIALAFMFLNIAMYGWDLIKDIITFRGVHSVCEFLLYSLVGAYWLFGLSFFPVAIYYFFF